MHPENSYYGKVWLNAPRRFLVFLLISFFTLFGTKSVSAGFNQWTLLGLEGEEVAVLAIDPTAPTTLYAGTSNGVFKSIDGGLHWEGKNNGLTDLQILTLAIDPQTPTTVYIGTFSSGVFKTIDGGEQWTATNAGLTDLTIRSFAIDPQTPTTLYAGTGGTGIVGVFKSTDGGTSWIAINDGLPPPPGFPPFVPGDPAFGGISMDALAIDPHTPTILYVSVKPTRFFSNPRPNSSIHKSTNGGATWTATGERDFTPSVVCAFVVDPIIPTTLYAGALATIGPTLVYKSTDGGEHWTFSLPAGFAVGCATLAINPLTPTTLYAGTSRGVFESTDEGIHWAPMNEGFLSEVSVRTLAITPDGTTLYAGTRAGVFEFQLRAAEPGPDLTGIWRFLNATCKESGTAWKCRLTGKITLQNIGLQRAPRNFLTHVYLSADPIFSEDDIQLARLNTGALRSGKGKKKKWQEVLRLPQAVFGQYVIAVIDPAEAIAEEDERNNRIVFGPIE